MPTNVQAQFEAVRVKAVTEWGALRRFISAHPLTGAWCFFGAGAGVGSFVVWVF